MSNALPATAQAGAQVLCVDGLAAGYGQVAVLHGVSFVVHAGDMVALVGANGAGKTTLLMCLSGLVRPNAGRIVYQGRDITALAPHRIVAAGLVHVPEGRRVFARMSVAENLELGAFLRRDRAQIAHDLGQVYGLFPILQRRRRQLAGTLSGGEQQMLAIGRAMLARPKLLLLDEPSLGLAPQIVKEIFRVLQTLSRQGVTILLVEQNARMALSMAHRGYVLEAGRIAMQDDAHALLADVRVQRLYLGG